MSLTSGVRPISKGKESEMGGDDSDGPLYMLVEEGSGRTVVAAREISGFFVDPNRAGSEETLIIEPGRGLTETGAELSDIELRVVSSAGRSIGSYYLGRVGLRPAVRGTDTAGRAGFIANFYGHYCGYPEAGTIWRRWASKRPLARGEWAILPVRSHDSWLHVVQNSWFETGHAAKRYGAEEVCVIDGRQILGESSFYCALGESINGPGGYFGSTLDGLADCLLSSRTAGVPFELVWQHSAGARETMGELAASAIGVLREFGVQVTLR
ncbi:barstar family protein [Actinosynnema sp. CA-248983]